MQRIVLIVLACILLASCAVNPVTGERELALISQSQEIAIGEENYLPSRQMQGGDYEIDPSLTAYVSEVGMRLARVADRQLPYEFVVLNNSTPNAWALPGGKIAVNRGLLTELKDEAELAAVLGHEIVHAAARHGAKGMERGLLLQGAVMAAGIAVGGKDYADTVVGGAQLAAGLIQTKYSRSAELEADHYGMHYMARAGYDPRAAVDLQETFVKLAGQNSQNWLAGLFASHPPSEERVAANKRTAAELGQGGMLGRAQYHEKIAPLLSSKDAYDDAEQGRVALSKKNYQQALQLGRKAVNIEPREGQFYALLGDVFFAQQDFRQARQYYDRAVAQQGDYFYYYLQRGLAATQQGDRAGAARDLEASVKLLPTATAYNALGNLSLAAGDSRQAKEYFMAAADSASPSGREALQSLVRLDLPDNPANYLATRVGLDRQAHVVVEVANKTPLTVGNIVFRVIYPDPMNMMHAVDQRLEGSIPAGRSVQINTGLQASADPASLRKIRVEVSSARVVE
jgi:predicted Zn-dependent protease